MNIIGNDLQLLLNIILEWKLLWAICSRRYFALIRLISVPFLQKRAAYSCPGLCNDRHSCIPWRPKHHLKEANKQNNQCSPCRCWRQCFMLAHSRVLAPYATEYSPKLSQIRDSITWEDQPQLWWTEPADPISSVTTILLAAVTFPCLQKDDDLFLGWFVVSAARLRDETVWTQEFYWC